MQSAASFDGIVGATHRIVGVLPVERLFAWFPGARETGKSDGTRGNPEFS